MATEYLKTIEQLARPLIDAGVYRSSNAFVKDLVREMAKKKIKTYIRISKKYQAKYGSFDQFSNKIKGEATPKQEDEWMEWEAAKNMLKAWKKIAQELGSSAA